VLIKSYLLTYLFTCLIQVNLREPVPETFEWLRDRTEHLDIFLFFRPSLNGVLYLMFCLLVEGECQILEF